jgi:hypothetical protein
MVVVDNARKMISKTIDVVVTSVLQTTAGRMIFGRHSAELPAPTQEAPAKVEKSEDTGRRPRPAAQV